MACVVCTVLPLTRASQKFGETRSRTHETYCLSRADVVFFRGRIQLRVAELPTADRVEVRFRASKGDQLREGAVISRVRACSPRAVRAGGGAVDLMLELMSCFSFALVGSPGDVWQWWWQMVHVDEATSDGRPAKSAGVWADESTLYTP